MAILGKNAPTPTRWLRTGLMQSRRVGRVACNRSVGSGFFIDGSTFGPKFADVPMFLTTQHLCDQPDSWTSAIVTFDGLMDDPEADPRGRLRRLIWSSGHENLDAALLVLDKYPAVIDELVVAPSSPKVNDPVYIFGYPGGGQMTFSRLDNLVLGETDNELHYGAPTEPGSSGSPVFNDHWEAVAMHTRWRDVSNRIVNCGVKLNVVLSAIAQASDTVTIDPGDRAAKPSFKSASAAPTTPSTPDFYSVFISYSHADKVLARRILNDLQGHGVRCWLDEHQIYPGDDIYDQVQRGVRLWDKIVLLCSKTSLTSWWVDNEIEQAFQKEQNLMKQRGHKVLTVIPLDLDGYLFDGWSSGKAPQLRGRLAADFKGWDSDDSKYEASFERLLVALRADSSARESAPEPKL